MKKLFHYFYTIAPENFAAQITAFVVKTLPDTTELEQSEILYGIHALIINLYKLPVIFIAAFFLGIFKETVLTFITFGALRTFASGIHARKDWTCLLTSAFVFLGSPLVAKNITFHMPFILLLFAFCLLMIHLYAPADTEEKPFVSAKLRKRLKLGSYIALVTLYILSMIYIGSFLSSIIIVTSLIECIMITPIIYKLFKRRYRNYEFFDLTHCSHC
jgi:accessory gene regulator B